jgi:hypothetical protein
MANLCPRQQQNVLRPLCKMADIFCPILTKFRLSLQIYIKVIRMKYDENPSSGYRADTCRRTDRHDKADRGLKKRHNEYIRIIWDK